MTTPPHSPLRLATETGDSITRIRVAGELDYDSAHELTEAAQRHLAPGTDVRRLHLDFADLTFCDSSGLSALLMVHRSAARRDVPLVLDNRPPCLERLLSMTGVLAYLTDADGQPTERHSSG